MSNSCADKLMKECSRLSLSIACNRGRVMNAKPAMYNTIRDDRSTNAPSNTGAQWVLPRDDGYKDSELFNCNM